MKQTLVLEKMKPPTYDQLVTLPKHKLVEIIKIANKIRKQKYQDQHPKYYGDLPRGFTKEQLVRFIKSIHSTEIRRLFLIQFFYALRIGEINNIETIPEQNILRIWNEKCDRWDHIPIHGRTIKLFSEPIKYYRIDHLQKIFRNTVKRIGLEYIYHIDPKGYKHRQFSTHTLRHTGITTFLEYIKDPIKTMRYSRHRNNKSYGSLPIYLSYPQHKMREELEQAFKEYYSLIE